MAVISYKQYQNYEFAIILTLQKFINSSIELNIRHFGNIMDPAKLDNDKTFFHKQVRPRYNNPTYVSSFMTDSLVTLNPPNNYTKKLVKQTEYRHTFQNDLTQSAVFKQTRPSNYTKYSKAAFEKSRSNLSNYGARVLGQNNR